MTRDTPRVPPNPAQAPGRTADRPPPTRPLDRTPNQAPSPTTPDRTAGRSPLPAGDRTTGQPTGRTSNPAAERTPQGWAPGRATVRGANRGSGWAPEQASGRAADRRGDRAPHQAQVPQVRTPGQAAGGASGQVTGQAQGRTSGQVTGQAQARTSGQVTGQAQVRTPGQAAGGASGQVTGQAQARTSGQSLGRTSARVAGEVGAPVLRGADRAGGPGAGQGGARGEPYPRHRVARRRLDWPLVAADCAAGIAGTFAVRPGTGPLLLGPLLAVLVLAQRRAGLYRSRFAPAAFDELPALAVGSALTWGFVAVALAATVPARALGWGEVLGAVAATVLVAGGLRAAVYAVRRRRGRLHPGSTLIIGSDPSVRQITAALSAHPEYGMRPIGIAAPGPGAGPGLAPVYGQGVAPGLRQGAGPLDPPPLPVLAGHGDITRAVIQNAVRHAVVTGPQTLDSRTTATVRLLAAQGICVWQVSAGPGNSVGPGHLWGFAVRRLDLYPAAPQGRWGKRALDATLASAALLCLTPVLAVCALAVRIADGPGVIFRQERIGLGGRPFTLLKFRTLKPADEHESATRWSVVHDRRMGAVGRLLRRTSLDELPQFWNVLRGDMSLVGPRPERPHFVEQFSRTYPGYQDRHRMPVGITGLAQVHGLRGDTSIADRARFDNHYIDSWSLWQDVSILLRTAASLFRCGGS